MKNRYRKTLRITRKRFGATFALATVLTLLLVSTAWAENITGYFRDIGPGQSVSGDFNGHSKNTWAGTLVAEIDGEDAGTFCTDIEHPIYYDEAFTYEGPATCQVAWLVTNYPPIFGDAAYPDSPPTDPLSNQNWELAARQAAVWYFSDGFVLNSSTRVEIRTRAQQIIDDVPDPCEITLETPNLDVTPADVADIYPDEATQVFTVTATQGGQPMAGLVVSLSVTPEAGFILSDATVTTGQDGSATFTVTAEAPGSVEIVAEASFNLPAGVMFSPVDGVGQRLVLGQPASGSVFASVTATWVPGGTIVGHVFHDRNMNGQQDEGEEPLAGWTVTLTDDGEDELETGVTTEEAGNYLFDGPYDAGLSAGTYSVALTEQSDYQRTTDAQVEVVLTVGGHGVANFGVIRLPVVRVCKYEDLNENGDHDEEEPWLSGWKMQLYEGDDDSAIISGHGLTGDDGCVALGFFDDSYYEEGVYYVGETLQDGWFNISPITQSFDLEPNELETIYFGNVHPDAVISLVKSGPDYAHENESITYSFTVTNEGNVKLNGSVSDPMLPGLDCSFTDLAPGQGHTCETTYTVPEGADDPLTNSASVSASDAYGHSVDDSDEHSVDILHPAIDVKVTATPATVHSDDEVTWEIVVNNDGDAPLTGVTVEDSEGHDYGPSFDLGAGESVTFTYTTAPTADVTRNASATGYDALEQEVNDHDTASATVITPDIEVGKTSSVDTISEGDPVEWTIIVYNRGDTTLYDVTVGDSNGMTFGPLTLTADDGDDGGGSDQVTWTYQTYPDHDTSNVATASGTDMLDLLVTDQAQANVAVTPSGDDDGDGTPDFQDLDSDGDGIPDSKEGEGDTDGDGTPDFQDLDSDGDGIPDSVEAGDDPSNPVDTDGDGTPDFQDLDSDGDGIPDSVEAGDDPSDPVDTDGDGTPDFQDLDSDGDGIPDSVEAGDDPSDPVDTDGDGTSDFQDLDSDGDGIPDSVEAGDIPTNPVDSDEDGTPDYLDLDSDGDGIPDAGEWSKGPDDPLAGSSADDPVCFDNDADGDGIPNYLDTDSDGDGIPDAEEGLGDSDGDGIPDWLDPDQEEQSPRCTVFLPFVIMGR